MVCIIILIITAAEDESTPTSEVAGDAAAATEAAPAAEASADDSGHAAGEQQQQGYAGQGDYSGYGSASAAVDYSTGGGYDPQAYAAACAGHYDPSAYGGYAGASSGYDHAAGSAAAPPAAAAPAVPSGPIPDSHSPDPPSKVLHFRNVTSELTQVCPLRVQLRRVASSCVVRRTLIVGFAYLICPHAESANGGKAEDHVDAH